MPLHAASALQRFQQVRSTTLRLTAPLSAEDAMVQSMPDASPAKWHLAHTTWFFETFILTENLPGYRIFNPEYVCSLTPITNRSEGIRCGSNAEPSRAIVQQRAALREHVDAAMDRLLSSEPTAELLELVELGMHHEQQHQELILTTFCTRSGLSHCGQPMLRRLMARRRRRWRGVDLASGRTFEMGAPPAGFAFDNERPRHRVLLEPFRLASRLVSNAEYLDFMQTAATSVPSSGSPTGGIRFAAKDGVRHCTGRRCGRLASVHLARHECAERCRTGQPRELLRG